LPRKTAAFIAAIHSLALAQVMLPSALMPETPKSLVSARFASFFPHPPADRLSVPI
jgi:hypothetical protein